MNKRIALAACAVLVIAVLAISGTAWAAEAGTIADDSILAAATPQAGAGQGWIGLGFANVTDKLAQRFSLSQKQGVVVISVAANGPAAGAGVKVGDLVTAANGVAVKTAQDVTSELKTSKAGDTITLSITRKTQTLSLTMTATAAPARINRLQSLRNRLQQALPPELKALKDVPLAERFSRNYGSSHMYKDKEGNAVTVYSIPGIVTAISPTSITITPNNPQSRGGPFSIDGTTRMRAGGRAIGADAIASNDKVTLVIVGDSSHASAILKGQATVNVGQVLGLQRDRTPQLNLPKLKQWLQRDFGARRGN